jgi:hypothetical protein
MSLFFTASATYALGSSGPTSPRALTSLAARFAPRIETRIVQNTSLNH